MFCFVCGWGKRKEKGEWKVCGQKERGGEEEEGFV